jgi:hypothetical protein
MFMLILILMRSSFVLDIKMTTLFSWNFEQWTLVPLPVHKSRQLQVTTVDRWRRLKYHELWVSVYKSLPVIDPSEMQIATLTVTDHLSVARQADVSHTWTKQLGEETRQCKALVEITVSLLSKSRRLTVWYRVIKMSLCTWWLQNRKLQVMFKVGSRPPGPGGR